MRSSFKYSLLIVLSLEMIFISCAKNSADKSDWNKGSVLRVGTDATYPPFEIIDTESGQPVGFDIDIMKAICKTNGWKPEFVVTPFDGIISGLKSDKYDCVISAMSITPERAAIVSFSDPYYLAGQVVAVPVDDSVIHSIDDLNGLNVGVQLGTTGERMAKSRSGLSVFSYDNIGAAFIDMENGHIDAVLNDFPTTYDYIKMRGKAKIVGDVLSEEHYGIAVRNENTTLLERINAAIEQMKSDGQYEKIRTKWFGTSPAPSDSL